ncbi:hypothetical protein K474DRAFT_1529556 [Panus rudis PR-1116 ss-1]|nr:hypothetical protein K474DRAFT_1529556 [Panus rudis PR-1116 ss-1]
MLDALDDDILSVVIDELRAHPQPFRNGLFSFSAACRKLRVLCEPVLFRRCRFIYVGTDETLPQDWAFYDAAFHISPHIQFLRMSIRASPLSEIFETLQALFARLHRLQTVFLPICEPRFSLDFVKVLLSAPNLENIVIQDIIWDDPPPYDPLSVPLLSPLKRYCESQEDDSVTIRKHPRYTAGPDIYTPAFRTELLWQAHSTIERIQIPIHPYHIQLFTSTSWDAMHELILYGLYPETAPPFIAIIQMMPNLRSLELLSWSKLVTVCPPEMAQTAELPPLQHLLIGNVSPADPFFTLLPPNIVSLGIRDVPRAYLPILLAGIPPPLSQVYQLFRSRGFPHLEHLEVVFKAPAEGYDLEEQLYASILQACPCVHSLEIHRYHSDSRNASLVGCLRVGPINSSY